METVLKAKTNKKQKIKKYFGPSSLLVCLEANFLLRTLPKEHLYLLALDVILGLTVTAIYTRSVTNYNCITTVVVSMSEFQCSISSNSVCTTPTSRKKVYYVLWQRTSLLVCSYAGPYCF